MGLGERETDSRKNQKSKSCDTVPLTENFILCLRRICYTTKKLDKRPYLS